MMVLMDTCIWSTALRYKNKTDTASPECIELVRLIRQHRAVLIGPILQEVLTGIRHTEQHQKLQNKLEPFELLQIEKQDYIQASILSNFCRSKGLQASHTDFLICPIAQRYQIPVFTADRDFFYIKQHTDLTVYGV